MGIQRLLHNQKILIDNHQRGSRTPNNWDNPSSDVHIDKCIKSNKDSYKIKIPINSNRPITINNKNNKNVPKWLKKEICDSFKDDSIRGSFVNYICKAIDAFNSTTLTPKQKAMQAIGNVRRAFELPIPRYVFKNDIKRFYAGLYMYNAHYYYVILKGGYILCSLNEGKWKRFLIDEESATYIYNKDLKATTNIDF